MRKWLNLRDTGRQQLGNFNAEFFKALAHPLRISILEKAN